MKNRHNLDDWIVEAEIPVAAAQPDPMGMTPTSDPADISQDMNDPNVANMMQQNAPTEDPNNPEDVNQDPIAPDMPEPQNEVTDFEVWKNEYFKESIVANANELMDLLNQVRDKENLKPYQRKFVEDNVNIQLLRLNSNVDKASKEIRRQIKQQLDKNNPATSLVNHVTAVLETMPELNNIFIKLCGYTGQKGDLHRKYIASLLGGVQVGSGGNNEDIIYNEKEYSILISTRFNSRWGDVMLGSWSLRSDDPERYLKEPELKRLQEGSPEEKDALRKRIVIDSIAQLFETRAFYINVVADDGTLFTLGWDIANSLRNAFVEGKLVVKTRVSGDSEAMIDDQGKIISLMDISIAFVKETGQQDEEGKPETEEIEFMDRKDGMLFLTADLKLIREATVALQGTSFKEIPYTGNPSDLMTLKRCVYSAHDLLMRQC